MADRLLVAALFVIEPPKLRGRRGRIGVADGRNAVADIDDARIPPGALEGLRKSLGQVGPAQRRAAVEKLPDGREVLRVGGDRLLEGPITFDVAASQVDRVAGRERLQHRGDELRLLGPLAGVQRGRRIG